MMQIALENFRLGLGYAQANSEYIYLSIIALLALPYLFKIATKPRFYRRSKNDESHLSQLCLKYQHRFIFNFESSETTQCGASEITASDVLSAPELNAADIKKAI